MKIFDTMKLKKVSEEDVDFLYDMLKERDPIENILHKEIPKYEEHVKFVTESNIKANMILKDKDPSRFKLKYGEDSDERSLIKQT